MQNNLYRSLRLVVLPFTVKLIAAFTALLFNFVATQFLSAEQFGFFSLAQVLVLWLVTFSKFGLDTHAVKYTAISASGENSTSLYSSLLVCIVVLSIFTSILFYFTGSLLINNVLKQPEIITLVPIISYMLLPSVLIALNSSVLRGYNKPNSSLFFSGLFTLILTLVLMYCIPPSSALMLLRLVAISVCIGAIFSMFLCLQLNQWQVKPSAPEIFAFIKPCQSLWIIAIVALFINQMSILFLAANANASDVGIYAIAVKSSLVLSFFPVAINAVFSPKIASCYAQNKINDIKSLLKTIQILMILFACVCCTTLYLFAEQLMLIFGLDYLKGALWFKILLVGQFVNLVTGNSVTVLIMSGHEKTHRNNCVFIALFTIILACLLIPLYGGLGAALTTACAMASHNLLSYYIVQTRVLQLLPNNK